MKFLKLNNNCKAVLSAILSAILFAICIPCSKILSAKVSSILMGSLLYLGAGIGLWLSIMIKKTNIKLSLTLKELPYMISMVVLDISAIILLMAGVSKTTGANASLIGNFELVATTIIAAIFFKEILSKKTWTAVLLITISCIILTFEGNKSITFNLGSILVLLSALCWGFENNCTRKLSIKDTRQITIIKGIFSGLGSLIIATYTGSNFPEIKYIITALLVGIVSYGISVSLYIYAQRFLGASKTASLFASSPFWGVFFCLIFLKEKPTLQFFAALFLMITGTIILLYNTKKS